MGRRRILVKVGGEALQTLEDRQRLAEDLARVRADGVDLCVVHGGGPQITQLGERLGLQSTFVAGRRVTDAPMLEAMAMAVAGDVGPRLMTALLAAGVPAVTTPAASAGCVVGRKRPPRRMPGVDAPVDYGLVADVESVDTRLLEALWSADLVPVLSSVVADRGGQLLNLNADSLVTGLTEAVRFDAVVLLTGVPGVFRDLDDPASHLPQLTDAEIPGLIDGGVVRGGMIAKLQEVAAILARGAAAVWIVGYRDPGAVHAALAGLPGTRTVVRSAALPGTAAG